MANTVISEICIVCDDNAVLNEIMDKYTTNGGLDFDKICPMPEDLKDVPSLSTWVVKGISRYLSIINPNNKAYEGHHLRQKYKMVSKEEMAYILEDLKRYGDTGLSSLLQPCLSPQEAEGEPLETSPNFEQFINAGMGYVWNTRNFSVPNADLWMERFWGTRTNAKTISKCEIIDNTLRTRIETSEEPRRVIAVLEGKYPTCKILFHFMGMSDASRYMDAAYDAGIFVYDKDYPKYNN